MAEQFDCTKFAGLELLPTSLLEEIIRTDFSGEENYSEDIIQYVLEVIAKRRKEEQPETIPDVQEAWKKLQLRMDAEDAAGLSEYLPIQKGKCSKRGGKRIFRYVALVAACVAIVFATLITVQAMGVDVFGALGTWTDSTFRFEIVEEETAGGLESSLPIENPVAEALAEVGLPTSMAPTWIPEEYALFQLDPYTSEFVRYVFTAYCASGKEDPITVEISEYYDTNLLDATEFFKSPGTPEIYVSNGRQFYIFRNADTWTATWSDGTYCITIAGAETAEIAKSIIDSIPVLVMEKNLVAEALSEAGLPTAFAPTWIPQGYELIEVTPIGSVLNKGVAATYTYKGREFNLLVDICEYYDSAFLYDTVYEKNAGAPEEYQSNGRRFYLFRNVDTWTAVWSDGRYSITIGGIASREDSISIIDSIQKSDSE